MEWIRWYVFDDFTSTPSRDETSRQAGTRHHIEPGPTTPHAEPDTQ